MRALVVSDTHFGAWTGDDLLSHEYAREALAPALEGIDELVMLGDLFDFLFCSVEHAFESAEPFLDLVREKLQAKRLVFLAGNHDHHLVVRQREEAMEARIAGDKPRSLYFERFLGRRLKGVECRIEYPVHRVGKVVLTHGHWLDAHVRGSLSNRLMNRAIWKVAGGRPASSITADDYEAVIVPLTEFLYDVAQLPRGTAAQRSVNQQLGQVSRLVRFAGAPEREIRRLARSLVHQGRAAVRGEPRPSQIAASDDPFDLARVVRPGDPVMPALQAFDTVVRNMGWDRETDQIVFAHTHQPLDGVTAPGGGSTRYWNTGSWIYEPSLSAPEDFLSYLDHGWPGTAVLIDTEEPEPRLLELLAAQNPIVRARAGEAPSAGAIDPNVHFEREVRAQAEGTAQGAAA